MQTDHSAGDNKTAIQIKPERAVALQDYHKRALVAAKEKYDSTVALINKRNEYFEREIKVIEAMAAINTASASKDGQINIELLGRIEKYLSLITKESLHYSNEVYTYINMFTITNTVKLLCEVINYFISSTGSYNKINSVGIIKLATQIASVSPFFKMVELFMIFRDGISGELSDKGTNFNKIDIEVFHMWVKNHKERMADYWELEASRKKPEGGDNNYAKLVDPKLKKLEEYRRELTQKLNIKEEVETKSKNK